MDRVHGETGAVDANAALVGDVPGQRRRCCQRHPDGATVLLQAHHLPHTVDMAADDMATQATGGRQRLFEVDPGPGPELAQGGEIQGFDRDIRPIAVTGQFDHGEADAVGADTVPQCDIVQRQLPGVDAQAQVAAAGLHGDDCADCLDNTCEHIASFYNRRAPLTRAWR